MCTFHKRPRPISIIFFYLAVTIKVNDKLWKLELVVGFSGTSDEGAYSPSAENVYSRVYMNVTSDLTRKSRPGSVPLRFTMRDTIFPGINHPTKQLR